MNNLKNWLEDPNTYRINRLDAHSDHIYYESEKDWQESNQTLQLLLNGTWQFHWSKNLAERPIDFFKESFDASGFDSIPVPSHIELNGYDKIHYINTMYPWDGVHDLRPPHISDTYNPVGSYITNFDLPSSFEDKEVCISFHGVEQAFSIWLNGNFIGYAEDTFTPSDFDLTPFIRKESNRLCVEVYKRSSSAWVEDQDFFRFSGIFRDVVLYAKPKTHVDDLWVIPCVNDDLKTGTLTIKVKMNQVTELPKIKLSLSYPCKHPLLTMDLDFHLEQEEKLEEAENPINYFVSNTIDINDLILWDINQPNLYHITLAVMNSEGTVSEIIPQTIGFRHFAIKNSVMYLNGKRLIINGVNRHEWNPYKGRSITKEDMIADIEVLKRNNITAVRTSHYPNQSLWYQLCDENGIILMDETNLESHGSWQKMGSVDPTWNVPKHDPNWRNNMIDRATSMFERDKNHPSILWWSCGNESYAGECILAMANYFRRKDASRYVHYEGCFYDDDYSNITDVYSRMYPSPTEIDEFITAKGTDKPYILCEYMHDMGNSLGGMESYQKLSDKHESYQGGFIWDYMDQAIYHVKNGKEVLGYGGDFTDRPTDYNFSGNGIVFADRTEKPAMQEVKFWYSSKEEQARHIEQNKKAIETSKRIIFEPKKKPFTIIKGDVNLGIKGDDFHIIFSFTEGGIVSLVYNNYEWLYRASKPTYWRALTENDSANKFAQNNGMWNYVDQYSKHKDIKIDTDQEDEVSITYIYDTLIGTDAHTTYTVYGDGTIKVSTTLLGKEGLPQLPLFGMRFITNDKISKYSYHGYSGETYPDRYKGGVFGSHYETVKTANYLVPQENGCHVYTHRLRLQSDCNHSLHIEQLNKPFHFSLLENTAQELEAATHKDELPSTGRSVLSILSHMRGVGGIDTWGSDVEEAYHIKTDKDLTLEFYIRK